MTKSHEALPLLKNPERLENRLKEIPPEPGVYLMRDATDRIVYIGNHENCDREFVLISESRKNLPNVSQ